MASPDVGTANAWSRVMVSRTSAVAPALVVALGACFLGVAASGCGEDGNDAGGAWFSRSDGVANDAASSAPDAQAFGADTSTDVRADRGPAPPLAIAVKRFEILGAAVERDNIPSGSPGNRWGGQQSRVARLTDTSVYAAYLAAPPVGDDDPSHADWVLLRRPAADGGTWSEVARRRCGREPMHLLRAPNDTLEVVSWPGTPVSYRITPGTPDVVAGPTSIPGTWETMSGSSTPYSGAGVATDGAICFIGSRGSANTIAGATYTQDSAWDYACRAANGTWSAFTSMPIGLRFAYPYVIPIGAGWQLAATRDVRWEAAGYTPPQGAFGYVFNGIDAWTFPSLSSTSPVRKQISITEPATPGAYVSDVIGDALIDDAGRLHVLSHSLDSGGNYHMLHTIVKPDGTLLKAPIVTNTGYTDMALRLVQDDYGRFVVFGFTAKNVYAMPTTDADGLVLAAPVDLTATFTSGGAEVMGPGYFATARGGTAPARYADLTVEVEKAGVRSLAYARIDLY